ncbi:MAG TPA: NTP transferase domain-containing protein [Polyangiaceae bacterium]|nr:NTP transferase domain-containing protein [Polyangiaceae bacterium]
MGRRVTGGAPADFGAGAGGAKALVAAGIFVGGASRRMSGSPKGLLIAPGGLTIVERMRAVLAECGVDDVVLVGASSAYAALGLPAVEDQPSGIGPLGGLVSLLRRADGGYALAFACDMPFVSATLVRGLLDAPAAAVVAPLRGGLWEPLCARYDAALVLPIAEQCAAQRVHSLQELLAAAGAAQLPLSEDRRHELRDWDAPEDVVNDGSGG